MFCLIMVFSVFSACAGVDLDNADNSTDTDISDNNGNDDTDGDNNQDGSGDNSGDDTTGDNTGDASGDNSGDNAGGDTSDDNTTGGSGSGDDAGNSGDDNTGVEQTVTIDRVTYTLSSQNTYAVTSSSLTSSDTEITIPDYVNNITVTSIGEDAFRNKNYLKTVTLPQTVKEIGNSAFNSCDLLKTINLENVESIGSSAFKDTIVLNADFSSLKSLGENAFSNSRVKKALFSSGITEIPKSAFSGCSLLLEVSLPDTVTEIKEKAFMGCSQLATINLEKIKYFGTYCFQSCSSLLSATLTDAVIINDWAFASTGLKNVTIGNDCIKIYFDSFCSCSSLETISLGSAHTKTWYVLLVTTDGNKWKISTSNSYPAEWREDIKDPVKCRDFLSVRNHNADSYIGTNEWFNNNPM